jgi:nitroreductase
MKGDGGANAELSYHSDNLQHLRGESRFAGLERKSTFSKNSIFSATLILLNSVIAVRKRVFHSKKPSSRRSIERILTSTEERVIMNIMEAIKGRRSVRSYRPDPIPEETVRTILEAVQWSPSWANTQCWEVVVVKDAETKKRLAETLTSTNPARKGIMQAPITLVLVGIKGRAGFKRGEAETDKGDWYMFDCGIAIQNLCLAAHAEGLGTVIVGAFDAAKAAEILQVPPDRSVVAMTPLGYSATAPSPPKRKEIESFVLYEGYRRR